MIKELQDNTRWPRIFTAPYPNGLNSYCDGGHAVSFTPHKIEITTTANTVAIPSCSRSSSLCQLWLKFYVVYYNAT